MRMDARERVAVNIRRLRVEVMIPEPRSGTHCTLLIKKCARLGGTRA
jgi:hypothetical protein